MGWGGEGGGAVEESMIIFFGGGGGRGVLPAGNYIPNRNVIIFNYFQLNLISSTYSVIVLSSFGILRGEFNFLSFFISIDIA